MSMYRTAVQRRGMRGDPGLFGFLGKVAGGVLKAIPGVGNVVSAIGSVAGAISGPRRVLKPAVNVMSPVAIQQGSVAGAIPPILRGIGTVGRRVLGSIPGQVAAGYGLGKAGEALFGGGGGRRRYRRMNATNPRALRRAIRRVQKFGDFARACGFSRPPAKLKGVGFPKRRKTCR